MFKKRILVLLAITLGFLTHSALADPIEEHWAYPTGWVIPLSIDVKPADRPIVFIAQKEGGVLILRERNNRPPKRLATIPKRQLGQLDASDLQLVGDRLYVALGGHFRHGSPGGLAIIDVANPEKPQVLSVWQDETGRSGAAKVLVNNRLAFVGAMEDGVHILDIRDPAAPRHLSTVKMDPNFPKPNPNAVAMPNARGMDVRGDLLFIANDAGGLRVVTIADPSSPVEISKYINGRMGDKQQAYNSVLIDGNYAYLGLDYCGLEVVDIRNPREIRQAAWWNPWSCETPKNMWFGSAGHVNQLELNRRKNRLYMSAGDSELIELDVSNPTQPRHVKTHGRLQDGLAVWGVAIHRDTAYLSYIRSFFPFRGTWTGVKAIGL